MNCARCGKAFPAPSPQHNNKLFCSRVCKNRAYRTRLKEKAEKPRYQKQAERYQWLYWSYHQISERGVRGES